MFDDVIDFIYLVLGIIAGLVVLIVIVHYVDVYYINDFHVDAYVNDELFYSGINACLSRESTGDTTTIKVYKLPLCIFPEKVYTGTGVVIR